jgi:hypothetical protein
VITPKAKEGACGSCGPVSGCRSPMGFLGSFSHMLFGSPTGTGHP